MSLWPNSRRRSDPHRRAPVPRLSRPPEKLRPPQGRAHTILKNSSLHWTLSVSFGDVTTFGVTSLYPVDRPVGSASPLFFCRRHCCGAGPLVFKVIAGIFRPI